MVLLFFSIITNSKFVLMYMEDFMQQKIIKRGRLHYFESIKSKEPTELCFILKLDNFHF